jgi:hypothetical protein
MSGEFAHSLTFTSVLGVSLPFDRREAGIIGEGACK